MARLITEEDDKQIASKPVRQRKTTPKTLPIIDVPTYDLVIPSTKEVIKVRPFTVKEEKLLLIAAESKSMQEIIDKAQHALNQIRPYLISDGGDVKILELNLCSFNL